MNTEIEHCTVPEMLPCPFCGKNSALSVLYSEDYYTYVHCRGCGSCGPASAIFESESGSSRAKAVEAWNLRSITEADAVRQILARDMKPMLWHICDRLAQETTTEGQQVERAEEYLKAWLLNQ